MQACGGFGFPSLSRDSRKQGKFGVDAAAQSEALYSSMRKLWKAADAPKLPKHFLNRIRHTTEEATLGCGHARFGTSLSWNCLKKQVRKEDFKGIEP